MVKNRPKEQPNKTETSLDGQNKASEHSRTFLSSHGWLGWLAGTLAGIQNRYWLTIHCRVEIENPTMALEMEDFAVNISALPLGTGKKGGVREGPWSTEDYTVVSPVARALRAGDVPNVEFQYDVAVTTRKGTVRDTGSSTEACTRPTQWLKAAASVGQRVGVLNLCRKAVAAVGNDFGAHRPVNQKLLGILNQLGKFQHT